LWEIFIAVTKCPRKQFRKEDSCWLMVSEVAVYG
jgi:hypothetical protein